MARTHPDDSGWIDRLKLAGLGVAAGLLLAGAAYGLLIWSGAGTYLALQGLSDPLHRLAVYAVPAAALTLILIWMLSELGRLRSWLRIGGRVLTAAALATLTGLPAFVLAFDLRLEDRGLAGERIAAATAAQAVLGSELPVGVHREPSVHQPNLAVEGLGGGDLLTLDRRSLARRRPDGTFAWHLARPGPPPASLSFTPGQVFYSGPGAQFEDDVVLAAIDLESGQLRWQLHCLGDGISNVVPAGDRLAFTTWRPATSAVHLVELNSGRPIWQLRLSGFIRLPPRFDPDGLRVAVDGDILALDPANGRELSRQSACGRGDAGALVCRDGRVVAWRRGVRP